MNLLKIKEVLSGKTLGKGRLYNPVTQLRCAVGQLLHAAGVPDTTLEMEEYQDAGKCQEILEREYSITPDEMTHIEEVNDNLAYRRTKIKGDDVLARLLGP